MQGRILGYRYKKREDDVDCGQTDSSSFQLLVVLKKSSLHVTQRVVLTSEIVFSDVERLKAAAGTHQILAQFMNRRPNQRFFFWL
jgi:hypothetical protein